MLREQRVTAIIPVRSGSKGIPGKNLYHLGKDTLLERAIKIAKLCKYVDEVFVSTDDPEMYEIAKNYKVETATLRPNYLALDDAKTIDVIIDLIINTPISSGLILLLQVTNPLRTLNDLNKFCETFNNSSEETKSAVSLVRFDNPHPDKIQKIENGFVKSYLGKEPMVARQTLPEVYSLNGAFYISDTHTILSLKSFMHPLTVPFVMQDSHSINLDSMADLLMLEMLIKRGVCEIEEYQL